MRMRGGRDRVLVAFLVGAASVLVSLTTSSAEPPPPVASLPSAVEPPPEGNGVPYDANPLVDISGASLDLAPFGYLEEEFLVSGQANVYQYGPTGAVEVKTADVPYTTRILVRRPANPHRFSGNVRVDTAHPAQGGNTFAWSADYLLANGDAFVSITTRRGGFSAIEAMKAFDPERFELNPDGTVKLDEHGNDLGGVRSSYLDVPTAGYSANAPAPGGNPICSGIGAQEHFSAEKLAGLYRNHGGYVSEAIRRINELERDGWLLSADAQELREEAAQFDGL